MSHIPLYLDIHALQAVPPSCINRDDTGSPKTARFGGFRRARVSSQAWKRAMRDEFAGILDENGVGWRTKSVVDLIARHAMKTAPDLQREEALSISEAALKATGIKIGKEGLTGYLLFVSPMQVQALAELAVRCREKSEKINAKEAKSIFNPKERPTLNAVDIALFGRMVADAPILNVDAAVQVAHAIGVSVSEPEFDYYTAMDDLSSEETAGAGMIGTIEFISATLYRYATLDVAHLYENLGSVEATRKAAEAFLRAFVVSMPTGRQNSFANRTLPTAVIVQARTTQPISLVGAFEKPVYASETRSITEVACARLAQQSMAVDEAFGTSPKRTLIVCGAPGIQECLKALEGDVLSLDETAAHVSAEVDSYLHECGFADGE